MISPENIYTQTTKSVSAGVLIYLFINIKRNNSNQRKKAINLRVQMEVNIETWERLKGE